MGLHFENKSLLKEVDTQSIRKPEAKEPINWLLMVEEVVP